jgi:hypothetical protein
MIKNQKELRDTVKERLCKKADELIDGLIESSSGEEFTIDTIEDLMTRFNLDSKEITLETINEVIASFDERKIIKKKNKK